MEEYFYNEGHRLMHNDIIRQNQAQLNIIREERSEPWKKLETDGIFGRETRDVVREFQKKYCQPANGRLDERTQREILNLKNQCVIHREQSRMRKSKPKVDLTVNSKQYNYFANPSVVCPMTGCVKVTPVSSPPPLAPSVDPKTYENDESKFVEWVKSQWTAIAADIKSIVIKIPKVSISKLAGFLIQELKLLVPKIAAFARKAVELGFRNVAKAAGEKLSAIVDKAKTKGRGYVKAVSKNPQFAEKFKKGVNVKSFAKGNAIGIALAAVPLVINLFKLMACEDSEFAEREKAVWESFRSFIGALLIMLGVEVAAGVLVAAGVVGGSVAIVAAIIGLVVAIIDIIVMACRDDNKGLSDLLGDLIYFIYGALKDTGESLGDWLYYKMNPDVPRSYTVYELELMGYGPDGLPASGEK